MRKKKALMNDYCGDKITAIAEPLNKVAEGYIAGIYNRQLYLCCHVIGFLVKSKNYLDGGTHGCKT